MANRLLKYVPDLDVLLRTASSSQAPVNAQCDPEASLELLVGRSVLEAVLLDNISALRSSLARSRRPVAEQLTTLGRLKAQIACLARVQADLRPNLSVRVVVAVSGER